LPHARARFFSVRFDTSLLKANTYNRRRDDRFLARKVALNRETGELIYLSIHSKLTESFLQRKHIVQTITKIGVISLAKILGMSGLIVGLIAGVIYGGILILLGIAGAASGEEEAATFALAGVGGGLMVMVVVPIFYGGMSFVVGLIYGLVINLVLSLAGGLELEIRGMK